MTSTAHSAGRQIDFVDAADLTQALATLQDRGREATILAGGTDVMVQYLRGDVRPRTLLHVRRIADLKGIAMGPTTDIGATTTHWQIMSSEGVRQAHPALAEAAATVGGRPTQNAGTVGGNLVNASPAADLLPVMLTSDGQVVLASPTGSRTLPIQEFVLGRRATARRPDEIVTRILLKPIGSATGETYLKIGRRRAMEVAVVGLSARLSFDQAGRISQARIALCSMAPKAFRATEVESRLLGATLDPGVVAEAGEILHESVSPIDDSRATALYRRRILPALLSRALLACATRAGRRAIQAS